MRLGFVSKCNNFQEENEKTKHISMSSIDSSSIKYNVIKFSSYSGIYTPDKILIDCPSEQTSRWSSESNNPPQYLILKLDRPAILKNILFGKYEKPHVCNLKRFNIYGSLTEQGFIELFAGGLKNDAQPETFSLRHTIKGQNFPCQYVKIVPIQSWAVSFNFSIWYVELFGDGNENVVAEATLWFKKYKEHQALRLCLKHLRQMNYIDVYDLLQKRSMVTLEHPLLTTIHQALVVSGDFKTCEQIITDAVQDGAFDEYVSLQKYVAEWVPVVVDVGPSTSNQQRQHNDYEVMESMPGMRGGHQMIIDILSENIYLFGGWDGCQDLSDFWCYNLKTCLWKCLSEHTELAGGPTPRSCHKMVLDSASRRIFCLGRYVDASLRSEDNLKNDFYIYCISTNTWYLISDDTFRSGGPKLIFDHHMVIDQEREIIYCFGGRILSFMSPTAESRKLLEQQFSGLYAYHIPTDSWALLRDDCNDLIPQKGFIRSRIGHSMLFHEKKRCLYIFAGQRGKEYLTDLFVYHIDKDEIELISDGMHTFSQVPVSGFTQRATIDTDLDEIYVFSGLNKDKDKKDDCVQNSFWVYNIASNSWSCIYQNQNDNEKNAVPSKLQYAVGMKQKPLQEPCPRYAHQIVYDNIHKIHYLFGGNPGKNSSLRIRLDDFWSLKLNRPNKNDLERLCKFMIRKIKYFELLLDNPVEALQYLRTKVSEVVAKDKEEEINELHSLANKLFENSDDKQATDLVEYLHDKRTELFNELSSFFGEDMMPPKDNLIDLIPI